MHLKLNNTRSLINESILSGSGVILHEALRKALPVAFMPQIFLSALGDTLTLVLETLENNPHTSPHPRLSVDML